MADNIKCRISAFRNDYRIAPGLYAVGSPDRNSDILVSANYKLSFDELRRELTGLDLWVLVLDTKGINVWCAAGKGTFGTEELLKRMTGTRLDKIVDHKRIIIPQLGAPGVSAHKIRQTTGFRVYYGPVYARDIRAYISDGYKATRQMRRIDFTLMDRLVLTPMEIVPAMKKYPLYAAIVLLIFGIQPSGIIFRDAFYGGLPFLVFGLVSVAAGAFLTPLLLPFIPFRAFAVKGWLTGMAAVLPLLGMIDRSDALLNSAVLLFFPFMSSYIALQFTGSTTFTGMTGVKKELKIAVPAYIGIAAVSLILVIASKVSHWGII